MKKSFFFLYLGPCWFFVVGRAVVHRFLDVRGVGRRGVRDGSLFGSVWCVSGWMSLCRATLWAPVHALLACLCVLYCIKPFFLRFAWQALPNTSMCTTKLTRTPLPMQTSRIIKVVNGALLGCDDACLRLRLYNPPVLLAGHTVSS